MMKNDISMAAQSVTLGTLLTTSIVVENAQQLVQSWR